MAHGKKPANKLLHAEEAAGSKQPIVLGINTASLLAIHRLLHLAAHRNKNQHRLAQWWGALGMLRRNVGRLLALLELEAGARGASARREWEGRVRELVGWMGAVLVPRCYRAFSGVVADNQYAALGLMLLATLARLDRVIRPAKPVGSQVQAESAKLGLESSVVGHLDGVEDVGEVVTRESIKAAPDGTGRSAVSDKSAASPSKQAVIGHALAAENSTRQESDARMASAMSKPAKKRRKKGDAFDELFSSLI